MKKIVSELTELEIKRDLKEAKKELKKVIKENKQYCEVLDSDVQEMAEEAAIREVQLWEDRLFIIQSGNPVFIVTEVHG